MDISHLRSISETHSHVVYVDSSMRDKSVYRRPAEYVVNFDSPFNNVVGMDILDASIPATMYTVDADNNRLALYCRAGGAAPAADCFAHLRDTPRTPALRALLEDASAPLQRVKFFRDDADPMDVRCLTDCGTTHPVHYVVARRFADAVRLGPAASAVVGASSRVLNLDADAYAVGSDGGEFHQTRLQLGADGAWGPSAERTALPVRFDAGVAYAYVQTGQAVYRVPAAGLVGAPLWSREAVYAPSFGGAAAAAAFAGAVSVGKIAFVWVARATPSYYGGLHSYLHEVECHNLVLDMGDHDPDSILEALRFVMPKREDDTARVVLTSASVVNPGSFKRNKNIRFQSQDAFWIDGAKTTSRDVLGFSERSAVTLDGRDIHVAGNAASAFGNVFMLDAPGIINLFGRRFITLRCPEIEQHNNSGLSCGNNSAGVGLFKLYDAVVSHLRFDFVNNRKIEFHPIGKLTRLHFRFELLDGTLYDFKGVDHHVFIALHFLRPRNVVEIRNPLNPDYEPDILKYITDRRQELDESETESDEELLRDEGHMRRFLKSRVHTLSAASSAGRHAQ